MKRDSTPTFTPEATWRACADCCQGDGVRAARHVCRLGACRYWRSRRVLFAEFGGFGSALEEEVFVRERG